MNVKPLIVAYYDGDSEVQCLSNFAPTPFELDGVQYHTVESFWQSLKTEDPILREKIAGLKEGFDAKQIGRKFTNHRDIFTYGGRLYYVGSQEHHVLLERAIRKKVAQNEQVRKSLWDSGVRPLRHMLKNRFGTFRPGDSPALPAIAFELMLTRIRSELRNNTFTDELPLPPGIFEQ